ncbi:hypothetical protein Gotri_005527 [Gossypium trilobum]|uniref:Uncharacterized protein n=1 Tax=Gossypium trilobum TaxID=34281 RepID=A0A7J9EXU6_9ROSI|nr:hypothetical protein [Gossypium trilobum]
MRPLDQKLLKLKHLLF